MEPRAKVWIAALRRSHDELAADVDAMNPDDLQRPSGASKWDVSGVLSHLGSGAEIGLAVWEANRAGLEPPSTESNQAVWDRWNAMGAKERAREFATRDELLVAAFESVDDAELDAMEVSLPFLPAPVDLATAVGFRLSEHALHSWDVHVAFTPDARVPTYAAELLVDRVPMMAGWVGRPDAWTGRPTTIEVRTTDPERAFWLQLGDSVSLGTEPLAADGRLAIPAEAFVRLSAGRLASDRTPAGVEATGSASLDDLRAVFPGY
jgi:uncharacterized protein (TIGR03083 family)